MQERRKGKNGSQTGRKCDRKDREGRGSGEGNLRGKADGGSIRKRK